jgi:hypothetical protein
MASPGQEWGSIPSSTLNPPPSQLHSAQQKMSSTAPAVLHTHVLLHDQKQCGPPGVGTGQQLKRRLHPTAQAAQVHRPPH